MDGDARDRSAGKVSSLWPCISCFAVNMRSQPAKSIKVSNVCLTCEPKIGSPKLEEFLNAASLI